MVLIQDGVIVRELALARDGDKAALERLLRLLHTPLHRFAERQLRYAPDAEDAADDIVQEALLRVAEHVHQCNACSDAQVVAWGLQISRRLLVDHYRSLMGRMASVRMTVELEEVIEVAHLNSSDSGAGTSPGNRVLTRIVRTAVQALPWASQQILALRLDGGRTWPEIAEILTVTPSAAKRRFQRLQRSLRKTILREVHELRPPERKAALRFLKFPSE